MVYALLLTLICISQPLQMFQFWASLIPTSLGTSLLQPVPSPPYLQRLFLYWIFLFNIHGCPSSYHLQQQEQWTKAPSLDLRIHLHSPQTLSYILTVTPMCESWWALYVLILVTSQFSGIKHFFCSWNSFFIWSLGYHCLPTSLAAFCKLLFLWFSSLDIPFPLSAHLFWATSSMIEVPSTYFLMIL